MPTAPPVWRPSNARVVVLDDFLPVPRGAAVTTPPALSWPAKDPGDVLDYQIDVSPALIGNEGDAIETVDVSITPDAPGDLTLTATAADGASAVLWLAGGQADTLYSLALTVSTKNGRTIVRNIQLPVLPLSAPAAESGTLDLESGGPLTDEYGNPLLLLS